ncbi:MAG: hypothetical protein M3Y19_03810 [Actinomycetota bacterium]|nr:hypothetical protein [Actinomycetota bacterium]
MLWAKTVVFAAVTLVVTIPSVLIAFFTGQSILTGQHIQRPSPRRGWPGRCSGRRCT